jgi:hypothetical protein
VREFVVDIIGVSAIIAHLLAAPSYFLGIDFTVVFVVIPAPFISVRE